MRRGDLRHLARAAPGLEHREAGASFRDSLGNDALELGRAREACAAFEAAQVLAPGATGPAPAPVPEYCSRVLHQLESEGLIRIDKRAITIDHPQCLRAYSSIEPGAPAPQCPKGQCAHLGTARQRAQA